MKQPLSTPEKPAGESQEKHADTVEAQPPQAETSLNAVDDGGTKAASASPTHNQRSEMNSPRKTSGTGKSGTENQNAIELLKADHQEVNQLFESFKNAKGRHQRKKLIEQIAVALGAHTIIEEEIFYPTCSKHGIEEDDLDEAQVEHDTIKMLVQELLDGNLDDDYFDAKVTVLSEYVKHHVKEEEEPEKGIFARVEKAGVDLAELGQELKERKDELMEYEERLLDRPPRIRSLHVLNQSLGSSGRSRDERGEGRHLQSESGRRSGGGYAGEREGGLYGSSRYPSQAGWRGEEAGGRGYGENFYGTDRDSDEDRFRGGPEGGGGRYGFGRGRGEPDDRPGGWYGDRNGHSAAARRGGRQRDY